LHAFLALSGFPGGAFYVGELALDTGVADIIYKVNACVTIDLESRANEHLKAIGGRNWRNVMSQSVGETAGVVDP